MSFVEGTTTRGRTKTFRCGWWPSEEDGLISCGKGKGNWIKRADSRDPRDERERSKKGR